MLPLCTIYHTNRYIRSQMSMLYTRKTVCDDKIVCYGYVLFCFINNSLCTCTHSIVILRDIVLVIHRSKIMSEFDQSDNSSLIVTTNVYHLLLGHFISTCPVSVKSINFQYLFNRTSLTSYIYSLLQTVYFLVRDSSCSKWVTHHVSVLTQDFWIMVLLIRNLPVLHHMIYIWAYKTLGVYKVQSLTTTENVIYISRCSVISCNGCMV